MTDTNKHFWLYVLLLENNKYYIGITSKKDPNARINEHKNGFYSAQWVKKHNLVHTAEIINLGNITETEASKLELQRTLQYMERYGYQNVRGGKLNYSGRYVKIGNRYFRDEDAQVLFVIILLMASVLVLIFK